MKQLYRVRIEAEIVVRASDDAEAAEVCSGVELGDMVQQPSLHVSRLRHLPSDWDLDCIPFGDADDEEGNELAIGDWIERGAAPEYRKRSSPLPSDSEKP